MQIRLIDYQQSYQSALLIEALQHVGISVCHDDTESLLLAVVDLSMTDALLDALSTHHGQIVFLFEYGSFEPKENLSTAYQKLYVFIKQHSDSIRCIVCDFSAQSRLLRWNVAAHNVIYLPAAIPETGKRLDQSLSALLVEDEPAPINQQKALNLLTPLVNAGYKVICYLPAHKREYYAVAQFKELIRRSGLEQSVDFSEQFVTDADCLLARTVDDSHPWIRLAKSSGIPVLSDASDLTDKAACAQLDPRQHLISPFYWKSVFLAVLLPLLTSGNPS